MSIRVMNMVWELYPNGGSEMLLAMALSDCSHDDGTKVFPSVAYLARRTRQSERSVQYHLRDMVTAGFLVIVANAAGGRSMAREYRIDLEWLENLRKGAEVAPFIHCEKGAESGLKGAEIAPIAEERVQPEVLKGATAIAPQPLEPKTLCASLPKKKPVPENYEPSQEAIAKALKINPGLNVALQTERFRNHHIARGNKFIDLDRAWWNWVTNRFVGEQPIRESQMPPLRLAL